MLNPKLLPAAKGMLGAGLSVVAVGKKKKPLRDWMALKERAMRAGELAGAFARAEGIGVIGGQVSGGVECIDFDNGGSHFEPWCALVKEAGLNRLLRRCYIQRTPSGGWHVVYRWKAPPGCDCGGKKLTQIAGIKEAVIETRAEGQYFVCEPSEGYRRTNGSLLELPVISAGARDALLAAAWHLSTVVEAPKVSEKGKDPSIARPGEDYAARTTWGEILEPHGWTMASLRGGVTQWCRPGKTKRQGIGATSGFGGGDTLRVFTTSTVLEPTGYTKFGAYAALNHGGDMAAAAKTLAAQGFGEKREAPLAAQSTIYVSQGVVAVAPSYLIEPYIQKGKMTLLDADGGVGKTGFAMALAAGGSLGRFQPVGDIEPFRTLYYGREDEAAELETIYYACEGRPGYLALVADNFPLNAAGLARVERDILAYRPGLVIFDPLVAFLSGVLQNINEALPVNAAMDALAGVFARTGAAGVNLRHTRKTQPGQIASEAGMGSVQFRNRHRSQLVMRFHPDREQHDRVVVMEHTKGSLLSPMGDPVCFERRGNAILFLEGVELPKGFAAGGSRCGPRPVKSQEAQDFLLEVLRDGKVRAASEVQAEALAAGITKGVLDKARADLKIKPFWEKRKSMWRMPQAFDDA